MLVVAGNLTIDDTVHPDGRTSMGAIGGDVLYTGLGAALWTEPVGLLSRMGDDFPPEHLARVRAAGLDCEGLIPYPGPSIRYWAIYEWDGRRHFISRNAQDRLQDLSPEPEDTPVRYARSMRAFHVAALPSGTAERLIRAATALPAAPAISLDTHEDFIAGYQGLITRLLPSLQAFLPSREEVALWFGDDDPERQQVADVALGPRVVVIKMGADGALVQGHGEPAPRHVPIVPVDALDTTGAGDAFCGGFVARLSAGATPIEAAMAGTVSASFAVEQYGIEGLLRASRHERDERLAMCRQCGTS